MLPVRLLVLSDTHFVRKAQHLGEGITRHFARVDHVVHAGDYTSEGVLDQLVSTGKFTGVRGNMDPDPVRERLPEIATITTGPVTIGIIHGWGSPDGFVERIHPVCKERGFDVVITGHVHASFKRAHDGILYINPGSPVDKMFAKENTYALVTIRGKQDIDVEFVHV